MTCGTKFANVSVRAERWDDRPDRIEGWEDEDELCFEEIVGDGALVLSGFDAGEVGLELSGLGAARVHVLARGRHRYGYSSGNVDELPPEEWLLRFYPVEAPHDPLAGGPRRIAGPA